MKKLLLTLTMLLMAEMALALPFVTTPSTSTYPIHWYQLKINDKYVYYDPNGGIFNQIQLTPTASSANNFLWCFVQVSSDKILIYNRAAQKYLEEGSYVTSDMNSSYISYVEERASGGFYIKYYHEGDNKTYYLYEFIDDDDDLLGSVGGLSYAEVFNAIEVLVEEDIVPVTELAFTPYDVYTPNNVQTDSAENYLKLFDKDRNTKWCVDNSTGSWETIWVDFKSNVPFIPTGYTMTTGNDTHSWTGRNPKKWKIYAKAHETDEWTTIVDVTDGAAAGLGTASTTDYSFNINGVDTGYQYFRFEVSELRGQGGWQNNHYVFQLAELALTGDTTTIPEETQAGILTVYDGNATSSFVPVYGLYADAYNKCQMIMPASELSDMVEGTISKLTWYLASPAVAPWGGYFQIYLSEVSQTTLPSLTFLDISGATLVYEGDLDGTGETMEIEFTQDYTYGGGNLLISVFEPETGHWKAATFAGTTVEGASTSGYSYSAFEECIATQRNFLPKTTFTYAFIDYPKPKNLTATGITSNGATITWEAGGDETSWGVEYKKATDEEWTSAGTVTEKTITLDALDNGVKYDVRVKSIYADGESKWVQISFSTPVYEGEEIDITLTPTTAYIPNNDNSNEDEDYHKLFDKDKSTKWCVVNPSGAWETIWVDFMSNAPFTPISYTMTTGDDTYQHRNRNPKKWKIYAKAHETDVWTTIVDVTDGEAAGLGNKNTTDYSFDIDGVSSPYQYFRFEVSEIGGQDNYNSLNYVFQLAELAMSGYILAVPGDSNGDNRVDVNDVTTVINHILGKNPSPFNADNADVNGDGNINVMDVTLIINIILGIS